VNDLNDINCFLKLGYYLNYYNDSIMFRFNNIDKSRYCLLSEHELINEGSLILKEAISQNFRRKEAFVVPISGGLDSRAIIAGLLLNTEAKNIYTYTFGKKSTYDYDIGNYVAKKLGTKHLRVPLEQYTYTTDELINISKSMNNQTILYHHPPFKLIAKVFGKTMIWSGFMGGELAGAHLKPTLSKDISIIMEEFIKNNTYVRSLDLFEPGYTIKELSKQITYDNSYNNQVTDYERIDFDNRQLKYIYPHLLVKGFDYVLPFMSENWFNFIMSVDNKFRRNCYLYKKILLKTFPYEFSLRTKTNFGLPLSSSRPMTYISRVKTVVSKYIRGYNLMINYLDFNHQIRENVKMREVFHENLVDLSKRRILYWLDIEKIWKDYLNNNGNYADALIALLSLEIHIKAKGI